MYDLSYIEEWIENIDAALFSGNCFLKEKCRNALKNNLDRWSRKLKEWEELEKLEKENNGI